jgi:hypothetical protein
MQVAAFQHASQRLARTEKVTLADELIDRRRPHSIRQRSRVRRR